VTKKINMKNMISLKILKTISTNGEIESKSVKMLTILINNRGTIMSDSYLMYFI
jgi:hypothetical protein